MADGALPPRRPGPRPAVLIACGALFGCVLVLAASRAVLDSAWRDVGLCVGMLPLGWFCWRNPWILLHDVFAADPGVEEYRDLEYAWLGGAVIETCRLLL